MPNARLLLEIPSSTKIGSIVDISVQLDTDGELINATEGSLIIPTHLHVTEIRTGSSFVSFWIESPTVSSTIRWSGMTPGGYRGTKGGLFTIRVRVVGEEHGLVRSQNLRLLRHDGKGTPVPVSFMIVSSSASSHESVPDTVPPLAFQIVLTRDPELFDGKWFAVFQTQDKESGMLGYRVQEGSAPWASSTGPYILHDQTRQSTLRVEATDRAGNHRVVELSRPQSRFNFGWPLLFAILIMSCLILILRKRR